MVNQLPTPVLVVDEGVLERNIKYMATRAKRYGIDLRPHIKTHKTIEITKMQLEAGAVGVTCAKVSEAEVLVDNGIQDIFIAYPVIGSIQLERLVKIASRARVSVAFDSLYGAKRISEAGEQAGLSIDVVMIVDTGGGRDGVTALSEASRLGREIQDLSHIQVIGVMTHEGHVYRSRQAEDVEGTAKKVGQDLMVIAQSLRDLGFGIQRISTGATPSCWLGEPVKGITEWRPGTYVFNDVQEWALGIPWESCALKIRTTVVSHPAKGRYIIDAGGKTLSLSSHPQWGYGVVEGNPNAKIVSLSEEHGTIQAPEGSLDIGQTIEVVPIHVCPTVNLQDQIWVKQESGTYVAWNVAARGCVI